MKIIRFIMLLLIGIIIFQSCHTNKANKRPYTEIKKSITQRMDDIVFGKNDAKHTMFVYASYHCKYCRFFFSRTFPELKQNYLDEGKIKLVVKFVEFSDNRQILYSLQAASCIFQFGQYEKFHELLRINPDVVFTKDFTNLIDNIMLDNESIAQCILENNNFNYIKENVKEFRENDLSGTPCLIMNNHAYSGFISYEDINKLINKEFKI